MQDSCGLPDRCLRFWCCARGHTYLGQPHLQPAVSWVFGWDLTFSSHKPPSTLAKASPTIQPTALLEPCRWAVELLASDSLGLILTTILGVIAGIARLSDNWLVRQIALVYVEIFLHTVTLATILLVLRGFPETTGY